MLARLNIRSLAATPIQLTRQVRACTLKLSSIHRFRRNQIHFDLLMVLKLSAHLRFKLFRHHMHLVSDNSLAIGGRLDNVVRHLINQCETQAALQLLEGSIVDDIVGVLKESVYNLAVVGYRCILLDVAVSVALRHLLH